MKQAGSFDFDLGTGSLTAGMQSQSGNRQRYALFRGWVHAAVNAIAMEGASKSIVMSKMNSKTDKKQWTSSKSVSHKSALNEEEVIVDHPFLDALSQPNAIQGKWQFVYNFIANLNLTGWSYIFGGENGEGKFEMFSLPTTWVQPIHEKGAFSEFKIVNPNDPSKSYNAEPFSRDQVGFAYIPDPSDVTKAMAPAHSQNNAISIDDHIQNSQKVFFENGVFPSVIITMGTNPHPDVPAGIRPRLTAAQRRQVHGAIGRVSKGVADYGNPAIIDGYIDKIERLSATQNEMGWEKSEKAIRSRILSAFGVHPFILGEEMAGSYAQAFVVQDRFCQRVNAFLDMLGIILTGFANKSQTNKVQEKYRVWSEPCVATDPSMEKTMYEKARDRGDITQNEFRAFMGLPPDVDGNEAYISKQNIHGVVNAAEAVAEGTISVEQGRGILIGLGLPDDLANQIAGDKIEQDPPQDQGGFPPSEGDPPSPEDQALDDAAKALKLSVDALIETPQSLIESVLSKGGLQEEKPPALLLESK